MPNTTNDLLQRFGRGDEQARDALLRRAQERLRHLAAKMLQSYPVVKRWEQPDDVLQLALMRLNAALSSVAAFESARHFWNVANQNLRDRKSTRLNSSHL